MKLFELGKVVVTITVLEFCEQHMGVDLMRLLERHQKGDWGELDRDDKKVNDRAVQRGGRIISAYKFEDELKIWIITEADRSSTCISMPEDY